MDEIQARNAIQQIGNKFIGEAISAEDAYKNLCFVQESKKKAHNHEWLYHCTTAANVKSILRNREFWLSNLKLVNDKEEAGRIDAPEYEKSYYVCCFTYDNDISAEHWEEYAGMRDGVLIAVKATWFIQKITFMCGDHEKCAGENLRIFEDYNKALEFMRKQGQRNVNPFFIFDFGFYQVVYDDELKKNMVGQAWMDLDGAISQLRSVTPTVPGIIKSSHGICHRIGKEDYEKDWTAEKETRLRVGIRQIRNQKNGFEMHDNLILTDAYAPKIAVPVSDDAFKEIIIKLSPEFEYEDEFVEELQKLLPSSTITVIA